MKLRDARAGDADAIAEIANHYIRDTTVTFNEAEKTAAQVAESVAERQAAGCPFLVAEHGGQVVGFASYGQFRSGSGYGRTMEHSVMLAPDARGQGAGRALIEALEARARQAGMGSLIGGISGENADAIAFHRALGYEEVARIPQAGFKFGRWIDLILLQKRLS